MRKLPSVPSASSVPYAAMGLRAIKPSLPRSLMSISRADDTDGADANAASFHFGNSAMGRSRPVACLGVGRCASKKFSLRGLA